MTLLNSVDKRETKRARLCYILASSHSGSTLLAMLLGAHRDAVTVGEINASAIPNVERYRCSCGEPIWQCGFWKRITARMARKGLDFDITNAGTDFRAMPSEYVRRLLRPLHRGRLLEMARDLGLQLSPCWRRERRTISARNLAFVWSLMEERGAAIVIDSSKNAVRLKYLLRIPGLDVKVVRLTRDGRAVALTYCEPGQFADASNPSRRGGGYGFESARGGKRRMSLQKAAHQWRRSNEEAECVLKCLAKDDSVRIRYEDLCENVASTMETLWQFLDLDPGGAGLDFRSQEHHVIGNGMRFDHDPAIVLDDRWRRVYSKEMLRDFDNVAGRMNRAYGYGPEHGPA